MKKYILPVTAALCLLLCGCSALLEDDYSVVEPHADRYWESAADDILRAESYQDLVNTILLLVEDQEESGVIRLYLSDVDYATAWSMVSDACTEVRTETAMGSYSLRALDFSVEELRNSYYEMKLYPDYRRTAEDIESIVNTSSSSVIYDMVLAAWQRGADRLTVRYTYLAEDEATLTENILLLQEELESAEGLEGSTTAEGPTDDAGEDASREDGGDVPPADSTQTDPAVGADVPGDSQETSGSLTPWEINFYPPGGNSSIIEIFFHPDTKTLDTVV